MIFAIQNAYYDNPLVDYPVLREKYGATDGAPSGPLCEHALIEINTLEQVMQLSKTIDQKIIFMNQEEDGYPLLLIYDGWIE